MILVKSFNNVNLVVCGYVKEGRKKRRSVEVFFFIVSELRTHHITHFYQFSIIFLFINLFVFYYTAHHIVTLYVPNVWINKLFLFLMCLSSNLVLVIK